MSACDPTQLLDAALQRGCQGRQPAPGFSNSGSNAAKMPDFWHLKNTAGHRSHWIGDMGIAASALFLPYREFQQPSRADRTMAHRSGDIPQTKQARDAAGEFGGIALEKNC